MPQPLDLPASARPTELAAVFDEIACSSSDRDAQREHPYQLLDKLRALRFGALRLPVEAGGAGASWRQVLGALLRLAEADSNLAHIFRNHFFVTERFVTGREAGYNPAWRAIVAEGGLIGLATTELDRKQTGGRGDLKTRLSTDGAGFRLDGTKYYSTGTLYADLTLVRATSPEGEDVSLIIPTDREGIERLDDWDGIGQRLTGTGTTNFQNVRVEADEILRDTSPYVNAFASTIAQTIVTTANTGVLHAVLRDAKALLLGRKRNFYYALTPVPAEDPVLQQTIGRIASEAFVAELAILATGDAIDAVADLRAIDPADERLIELSHQAALAAAKTKVIVDEFVLRSASALFDVGGASAATLRQNLDRHWRNARTLSSHNPASYKALALGAHELSGAPLPNLGFF
ncbi:acyl-CoA dehydrogenase [Bosea sp. RCC_152_1]|uniref:acyl-CoA dehydrogenase n=1 Tax=Bosea sp. RCC_152_1 TaxID=3239228 RepID=UPI0035261525